MIKVNLGAPIKNSQFLRNKILENPDYSLPRALRDKIKVQITQASYNKCVYCETKFSRGKGIDIDHYRPIQGARDQDGTIHKDRYWWLKYDWDNILPLCKECNVYKSNRFPILSPRVPIGSFDKDILKEEQPLLIHPTQENPEEFILYNSEGFVYSNIQRAEATIDIVGLNRSQLVERRRIAYNQLMTQLSTIVDYYSRIRNDQSLESRLIVEQAISFIKSEIQDDSEFSGLKRYFIRIWLEVNPNLTEYLILKEPVLKQLFTSRPKVLMEQHNHSFEIFKEREKVLDDFDIKNSKDRKKYFGKRRHIERIIISNFRTIKELDIKITLGYSMENSAPWLMLLGDNGTGKSTILHAVALTLMDKDSRSKYLKKASSLLYPGAEEGFVTVFLSGSYEPITIRFRKGNNEFEGENHNSQRVILLGYGSTRLLPKRTSRREEHFGVLRVDNLFNPLHLLTNASKQLYRLDQEVFEGFCPALQSLLLLEEVPIRKDSVKKNKITVHYKDRYSVSLDELSDGYRSMVALCVDILMALWHLKWTHKDGEAIVLIDELDAHLHPKWIIQIVTRLRDTFPKIQFIVTSHDPLCLRGLDQNEVVVLKRDSENEVFVERDLPPQSMLEVDTLLKSQFFGLNYTLDPQTNEEFNKYYKLLALPKLTEEEEEELQRLRDELITNDELGYTQREQMMYQVIDEYMAMLQYNPLKKLTQLKEDTKKKVRDILTSVEGIDKNPDDPY